MADGTSDGAQQVPARQLLQHDHLLGYRFLPGLKARIPHEGGGYLVRTNQDGFRCDNEVTPRKAKAHRVLVFGDSYTAGDGVSNGKRYSDVLERCLANTEVLNFGLSGTGTDQQLLIFREYAERVEHDVVVIGVLVENIQRNTLKAREWIDREGKRLIVPKPWFELTDSGSLRLQGVPVPRPYMPQDAGERYKVNVGRFPALRRYLNRFGPDFKDSVQKLTRYQPLPEYNSASNPAWVMMRSILESWISESVAPVTVMVIPVYQYVEETANYARIRARFDEFAKSSGASVYHAIDDLLPHAPEVRRSFRFRTDAHLTPLAHRVIGESLAKVIAPVGGAPVP